MERMLEMNGKTYRITKLGTICLGEEIGICEAQIQINGKWVNVLNTQILINLRKELDKQMDEPKAEHPIKQMINKNNLFVGFMGNVYRVYKKKEDGTMFLLLVINERGNIFYKDIVYSFNEEETEVINHFCRVQRDSFKQKWEKMTALDKWGVLYDKYAARERLGDIISDLKLSIEERVRELEPIYFSE